MNITVLTPPPFEPISVAQVYEHLRWDTETNDDSPPTTIYPLQSLIEGYIVTARQFAEAATRRCFIQQTLRLTLNGFPTNTVHFGSRWNQVEDLYSRPGKLELPRPPLISLLSVRYLDDNEVLQTLAPSNYYLDDSSLVPQLVFRDTFDVGIVTPDRQDSVRIEYVAGYPPGDDSPNTQTVFAQNVPQWAKSAMLLHVQLLADRFDPKEREDIERARDALLNQNKVHGY